jgi:hypothetical protein
MCLPSRCLETGCITPLFHRCLARTTKKTQPHLLLLVGPCLQSYCLATRWSDLLQYQYSIVTWRLEAAICPFAGRGFAEHVPVATRKAPLLDGELLETNTTEEAMHCIHSDVSIPRQCIQKRFRPHGNEPPKHSNSEEYDSYIVEGGDLHIVRPEPTSGRKLTRRRQNTTEHKRQNTTEHRRRQNTNRSQKKSEVKSLFYVV